MKSLKDFNYLLSLDRRYTKTESEIFRYSVSIQRFLVYSGLPPFAQVEFIARLRCLSSPGTGQPIVSLILLAGKPP